MTSKTQTIKALIILHNHIKGGEKMSINRESRSVPEFSLLLCLEARKTLLIEREKLSINSENAVCHDKIVHWTNGCYALGMRRRI